MAFSLRLFGGVALESEVGPLSGAAVQRHRLALLAVLGTSRPGALTRDKLMALLWPERDAERARGLLNQAVHVLRRTLGADALPSVAEELQLNPAIVSCDVTEFEDAVARRDLERAAALYTGPFLDGFFLSEAQEFADWTTRERERLASAYAGVLESLAEQDEVRDPRRAIERWRARAALDPYDSRVAHRLMQALDASGNRAAALQHAEAHQRLLRDELGIEPSPEVHQLAGQLRSSPATDAAWNRPRLVHVPAPPAPLVSGDSTPAARAPSAKQLTIRYGIAAILVGGAVFTAIRLEGRSSAAARESVSPRAVDEIAQAVARELALREQGDTARRLPQQRTRNIAAYEMYLRGSDPAVLRTDSGARQGLEYFRRAIALDSNYAAAWAGLVRMILRTRAGDSSMLREAEEAARRAIALDDSLAEAHASLGLTRNNRWDLDGAETHIRRAVALDPREARFHEYLVRIYAWRGRAADAVAEARRSVELAPLSPSANAELARALMHDGRCDEALVQLKTVAGLNPPLLRAPSIEAQCYAQKGMWLDAIAALGPQGKAGGRQSAGLFGNLLARAGRRDEANRLLDTLLTDHRSSRRNSLSVALVYGGLGNTDSALAWLARAVDDGSLIPVTETAMTVLQFLEAHRDDPRVASFKRRVGLQNR